MSINIHLPKFEGPLALLLYLIRKEEMDIFDINIHDITRQYLDFIKLMKELDLELAGEFVAMAATLIHIKSKMLLPQYNDKGEIIENEDPRKELVQKLLEYQKFQEAARNLYERSLLGRDTWPRGVRESLLEQEEEIILEDNALFSLIATYRKMLKNFNKKVHKVTAKAQSIASRILEIKDRLLPGHRVGLMDLVTGVENRARTALITFLSILELAKMGFVSLYQSENYAEIWIEATKTIETDVITRVEEYDAVNSEAVAEKLMGDSKTAEGSVAGTFLSSDEGGSVGMESFQGQISIENEGALTGDEFVLKDAEDVAVEEAPLSIEEILASTQELTADMELLAAEAEQEVGEFSVDLPDEGPAEMSTEVLLAEESTEHFFEPHLEASLESHSEISGVVRNEDLDFEENDGVVG